MNKINLRINSLFTKTDNVFWNCIQLLMTILDKEIMEWLLVSLYFMKWVSVHKMAWREAFIIQRTCYKFIGLVKKRKKTCLNQLINFRI